MISLTAAALAFVLFHLLVSGTPLRDALVRRIGANVYMTAFSVVSLVLIVWVARAYAGANASPANRVFWTATRATTSMQDVLQIFATLFVVVGLTNRNPTRVAQEAAMDQAETVRGMLRITRHPFLWGVAIWAAGHLLVNGNAASLIFFASFFVLGVYGPASIDAKRRRAYGERWSGFAERTSSIPFAAIVAGRQRLAIGEIGWWRLGLALVVYIALVFGHPYLFGVAALPNG